MLTSLEVLRRNAGHIRPVVRNGQGGLDEPVKDGMTSVIYDCDAPMCDHGEVMMRRPDRRE